MPTNGRVEVLETSLREGQLAEGITFTLDDKLECLKKFIDLGFDYVEAGFALAPTLGKSIWAVDRELFTQVRRWSRADLGDTKIVAYGLLPVQECEPLEDPGLLALLDAGTEWVSAVGHASRSHVETVLEFSKATTYLRLLEQSIRRLRNEGRHVLFLAEECFAAYEEDPLFTLEVLEAARAAGADRLVLCDTRGGSLPHQVGPVVAQLRLALETEEKRPVPLGFHGHNDGGLALANTLAAVLHGAAHVHGTVNGIGERCGSTDLTSVLANLDSKMHYDVLEPGSLTRLRDLSRFMYHKTLRTCLPSQPFVGEWAVAHKKGMVSTALLRQPEDCEHVRPEDARNRQCLPVGDLSDLSVLRGKLQRLGLEMDVDTLLVVQRKIEGLEQQGWQFDTAEASFVLLVLKLLKRYRPWFELQRYCVLARGSNQPDAVFVLDDTILVEASVKLKLDGRVWHTVQEGNGPVHALELALREALRPTYPRLDEMALTDCALRVIDGREGTGAQVRVVLQSWDRHHNRSWKSVAVSDDMVRASWLALVDALEFKKWLDARETSCSWKNPAIPAVCPDTAPSPFAL
jgi:2-isopropylmalate synthase